MHIRRATLADTADMATMASNAMLDDEFVVWLCPNRQKCPYAFRATFLHRIKKRLWAGSTLLIMVTDEDDAEWNGFERVISYIAVTRHGGPRSPRPFWDAVNAQLNRIENRLTYYLRLDKSIDYLMLDRFTQQIANGPLAAYDECWEIEHLSVDNNFQRRGVGQQMVRAAQSIAAKDVIPVILLASLKGIGMYTKCGFRCIGDIDFGELKNPVMIWNP